MYSFQSIRNESSDVYNERNRGQICIRKEHLFVHALTRSFSALKSHYQVTKLYNDIFPQRSFALSIFYNGFTCLIVKIMEKNIKNVANAYR